MLTYTRLLFDGRDTGNVFLAFDTRWLWQLGRCMGSLSEGPVTTTEIESTHPIYYSTLEVMSTSPGIIIRFTRTIAPSEGTAVQHVPSGSNLGALAVLTYYFEIKPLLIIS